MEIVVDISKFIALIATTVGIVVSVYQYRLKVKAEVRLKLSSEAESDVRLLTLFTELMNIANGRSGYVVSDKAIEIAALHSSDDYTNSSATSHNHLPKLKEAGLITLPVGLAAQSAAMKAIEVLAIKYPILEGVGIDAFRGLEKSNIPGIVSSHSECICNIKKAHKH